MCYECRQTPCHPACPNAPDPEPVHICKECGYGIFDGDQYWDSPEGAICEDCLSDMSHETILAIIGDEMSTAERREHEVRIA